MSKSPWIARARRRGALLWSIAAAVFVLALLLSLAAGLTGRAPVKEVRSAFTNAAPAQRTVTATASARGLTQADQDAASRTIAKAFGTAPITVTVRDTSTTRSWTIAPDIPALEPSDLPALQHGFDTVGDSLSSVLADAGGVTARGSAAATTATIRAAVQTVTETAALPLGIIAVAGLLAVGMLAQLLVAGRAAEDRLLRSRGASSGLLIGRAAVETSAIAVPAAVLGAAAAQIALQLAFGAPASVADVAVPLVVAALGAVATVVVVTVPAVTRPLGDAGPASRRAPAIAGIVVLLIALAGLSAWRFANAGDAAGVAADPLARIAPAVVLVALAALMALLFTPVVRVAELPASRGRRLPLSLAARFTARGAALLAAPALLITLAVSVGAVASGAAATSASFLTDSARVVNGGAARLTFAGDSMINSTADLLPEQVRADATGSAPQTAPVLRTSASLGSTPIDVVGVPSAHLPTLVPVAPQMFDAVAARAALAAHTIAGPVLEGKTVTATVQTKARSGGPGAAGLTLWLVDAAGDVAPVAVPPTPMTTAGTTATRAAALPTDGPWTVAAIDVTVHASGPVSGATVTVIGLASGGRSADLGSAWTARTGVFGTTVAASMTTAPTTTFPEIAAGLAGGAQVRLMPAGSFAVPVVISDALAAQIGLKAGTSVPMEGQVSTFQARVVQTTALVPGTTGEPALLADLPTLVRGQLAQSPQLPTVGEAWTFEPQSAAQLVTYADGRRATVQLPSTTIESGFVQLLSASLWIGAIGAAAFAVLGIAATIAALQRRRRPEIDVLRQVGVTARTQAGVRIVEPAAAVVYSLIAGAVAGLLAAVLIVPAVARTSAPSAPEVLPVVPQFAWAAFAVLAAAIVVASGILLAVQHRATLRDARFRGADR